MSKFSTVSGSENYTCQVVRIGDVHQIPDADRIKRVVVNGFNVIVGNTTKPGDLMLFFPAMCQLSEDFCKYNNLYDKPEMNADTTQTGYLSSTKRRVKALKLKGVISEGLLMPLSSLEYIYAGSNRGEGHLVEGVEFTHFFEIEVCKKYVVPVRSGGGTGAPKAKAPKLKELLIPGQLRFHHETTHLAKNAHKLNADSEIVLTEKVHGSSNLQSRVKVLRKLPWKDRIAKALGVKVVESEYAGIWSSGKPKSAIPKGLTTGWKTPNPSYYTADIWKRAWDDYGHTVEPGITIYSELIGPGIQGKYTYDKLIPEGKEYAMLVYRITRTNDEGHVDEFSWNQVEEYCEKYGLSTVPVIYKGKLSDWYLWHCRNNNTDLLIHSSEDFMECHVNWWAQFYLEKKCPYTKTDVWAEGICVRREKPFEVFKLKSKNFVLGESDAQEKGETNIEDES